MGTMVHSLLWVMQDLYHQPYVGFYGSGFRLGLELKKLKLEVLWLQVSKGHRV